MVQNPVDIVMDVAPSLLLNSLYFLTTPLESCTPLTDILRVLSHLGKSELKTVILIVITVVLMILIIVVLFLWYLMCYLNTSFIDSQLINAHT